MSELTLRSKAHISHKAATSKEKSVIPVIVHRAPKVGPSAKVIDSVLMPGAIVEDGAVVTRALVADNIRIGANAVVGSADSDHIELVAKTCERSRII